MRSYKVADMLYDFEASHGHLIETALTSVAEEQENAARLVEQDKSFKSQGFRDEQGSAFRESAQRYREALEAWRKLADAISEREETGT